MGMTNVLNMLCGLALFLYGMHVMGEGLTRASGGKLEGILEKLTKSKLKAVLLGAAVTAVIQSSSATTVMVVGFVNSGIMRLSQAAGVIMGANIGTTITSWILSLTGIQGDNLLLTLCKPSTFTPVLAMIGVICLLFTKSDKKHDAGSILVGFAVLMTGMEMMSGAVKPLANVPEFTNILLMFTNPILGVIAGMLLTAIIQSSSASVGILQALCATGAVKYSAALPIIMGQNIGTCVTALLAGVGASKNAKRAALIHLYFNIIGTVLFMAAFYGINAVFPFAFLDDAANAAGIAVIHTTFNIIATAVLLPFSGTLEKLATLTIRDDDTVERIDDFQLLDERFLSNTAFAVEQCKVVTDRMAQLTREAIFDAIALVDGGEYTAEKAERIEALETKIDRYEDKLGTYMVKLSRAKLSQKDGHTLSLLLHSISDFERIADHAVNILESAEELHAKKITLPPDAQQELSTMERAVQEITTLSITAFQTGDLTAASRVEPLEQVIDTLKDQLRTRQIARLQKGACSLETGFIWTDLLTNFERVADHCSNIAGCVLETQHRSLDLHEYLDGIKQSAPEFRRDYEIYSRKYALISA